MPSLHAAPQGRAPASTAAVLGIVLALGCGPARAAPPIRSAEDAICRKEARARVFSTPNPYGLEPEAIGRRIYFACLRRLSAPPVMRSGPRPYDRRRY